MNGRPIRGWCSMTDKCFDEWEVRKMLPGGVTHPRDRRKRAGRWLLGTPVRCLFPQASTSVMSLKGLSRVPCEAFQALCQGRGAFQPSRLHTPTSKLLTHFVNTLPSSICACAQASPRRLVLVVEGRPMIGGGGGFRNWESRAIMAYGGGEVQDMEGRLPVQES